MRFFKVAAGVLTLALAACATSSGERATAFLRPEIARAYVALDGHEMLVLAAHGAGFVIAPGIAVTNAHNGALVDNALKIGESRDYDLLFFRTDKSVSLVSGTPRVGQPVIAYGQGADGELREARGIVRSLGSPVEARCSSCAIQSAFTFEGNAGPGFSGGPVVDAQSGALIGITFGYLDPRGHRLMYAYPMSRVREELESVQRAPR